MSTILNQIAWCCEPQAGRSGRAPAYEPGMGSWLSKAKDKVIKATPFFKVLNPIVAKYGGYLGVVSFIFPPVGLAISAAVATAKYEQGRIDLKKATAAQLNKLYTPPAEWREDLYLSANADVAAGVKAKKWRSGWQHYVDIGYAAGSPVAPGQKIAGNGQIVSAEQPSGAPADWNEMAYLAANPDIVPFVTKGNFSSGWAHYQKYGQAEGRKRAPAFVVAKIAAPIAAAVAALPTLHPVPAWWNEAAYLKENPDVAAWVKAVPVAQGQKTSGWAHFDWWARGGTDRQVTRQRIARDKAAAGIVPKATPVVVKQVNPAVRSLVNSGSPTRPAASGSSSSTMLIAGGALLALLAFKGKGK